MDFLVTFRGDTPWAEIDGDRVESSFVPATTAVAPDPDEVHVWRVDLNPPTDVRAALEATLSDDEKARAARFHFERHGRRYAVGRGALRRILAACLEREASAVSFRYGPQGKPELAGEPTDDGIHFNVSNSDELALIAVTRGRRVGVDLEFLRPVIDLWSIAQRYFSASEVTVLGTVPETLQKQAFFNCWTRKEAFIKAIGEGLSFPLDRFCVTLAPGDVAALLAITDNPEEVDRWSMADLHPGPEFVAAIVVEGRNYRLQCWNWTVTVD